MSEVPEQCFAECVPFHMTNRLWLVVKLMSVCYHTSQSVGILDLSRLKRRKKFISTLQR